jgi:ABC-type amino acid transport substrate-binding protein
MPWSAGPAMPLPRASQIQAAWPGKSSAFRGQQLPPPSYISASTAEVKLYSTLDGALADLKAGRLDYVSDFVAFLTPFLDANPGFAIKTAWPLDPILNQGVAIAIRQDDTVLRDKLNSGLAAVISSGTYDQILGRYPGLGREIRKPQF